jgi:hypothetical protein
VTFLPRDPQRLRQANATLVQRNSRYEAELRMHYQPEGAFQQSVLGKFKEENDVIMRAIQLEHERRMKRLEQDDVARQKFWQDKDRELQTKFQVCNGEWS